MYCVILCELLTVTHIHKMNTVLILLAAVSLAHAKSPEKLIVGGAEVAPIGKWPWQGSFQIGTSHNCGCVLVQNPDGSDEHIYALTAAHCAESDPSSYQIIFGAHDLADNSQGQPEIYTVTQIQQHPDWTNSGSIGFPNDIAVLTLDRAATPDNNFISPIALATDANDFYTDAECWISGWGRLEGGGPLPDILQETEIPTIDRDSCASYWPGTYLNHGHICVIDVVDQDIGACNGDSGGPLQCTRDGGESWELVGLTSWIRTGCLTDFPSVYNKVGWYSEWAICVMNSGGTDSDNICDSKCPCDSSSCDSASCTSPTPI